METPRNLARALLEFCSDELGWEECGDVSPYYEHTSTLPRCELPNRPKTRAPHFQRRQIRDRSTCERLGGTYTAPKVVLREKRIQRRYIPEDNFDRVCPICFEDYGKYRPPWACEECDHYMCVVCFDRLMRDSIMNGKTEFACPLCRGPCTAPEDVTTDKTKARILRRSKKRSRKK